MHQSSPYAYKNGWRHEEKPYTRASPLEMSIGTLRRQECNKRKLLAGSYLVER